MKSAVFATCVRVLTTFLLIRTSALLLASAFMNSALGNSHYYDLAFHWAPLHIQNVDSRSVREFITRFDFDGNWKGTDNENNLALQKERLEAVGYYAVTESQTHYFLYYGFFHPRDAAGHHENDMEGALVVLRKDASEFGALEGVITTAHGYLFPYKNPQADYMVADRPPRSIRTMQLAIGRVPGETHARPWTYQEDNGHGMYHCGEPGEHVSLGNNSPNLRDCGRLVANKIIYVPTRSLAEISALPEPGASRNIGYRLIDANAPCGLFSRRFDRGTFADFSEPFPTNFAGDGGNKAQALWGWRDRGDNSGSHVWGKDPALLVRTYWNFSSVAEPSSDYMTNDFAAGGNVCTATGVPFAATPESPSCVRSVCVLDPWCCDGRHSWDSICVGHVADICRQSCNDCMHSPFVTGSPLGQSCSQCVAAVCNEDAWCCSNDWDPQCVGEASVCRFHYAVHQQDNGWIGPCVDGQACGKTGKQLEGVRIYDPIGGGTICYSAHIEDRGWQQGEVCSGQLAGTQGESKRLEAIAIRLKGAPIGHSVCYRAYVQGIGWQPKLEQPEVCNNAVAGTTGRGEAIESLSIRIVTP